MGNQTAGMDPLSREYCRMDYFVRTLTENMDTSYESQFRILT